MRKLIIFLILIFTASFSGICYAEDMDDYLAGRALNVIETENEINIYMRISITDNASDYMIPNTAITYEKAFFRGVKETWEGSYKGKNMNVIMERVSPDDDRKHIKVIFDRVNDKDDYCCALKATDTIWMYSGDGRNHSLLFYDYQWFKSTAGHEMGHILGLGDVYSDENEQIRQNLKSPMNRSDETPKAQELDYYIILTHRTWERNSGYRYSDDIDAVTKHLSYSY